MDKARKRDLTAAYKERSHPNKALQAVWSRCGEAAFTLDELEQIDDAELTPIGVAARLAEREQVWRAELGASKATG